MLSSNGLNISQLAQDVKERLSKDKSLDVKDSPKEVSDNENQSNVPVGANVLPPGKSDEEQGLIPDEFEYHDAMVNSSPLGSMAHDFTHNIESGEATHAHPSNDGEEQLRCP
ncbi:hypothetical protein MAR_017536 [Mya arenaria]|uniref:Uncharacterized protein n=1 Tax=Mya arenaria TaxID=6604 RepID=A0ABY7EC37_MYAAR|nr:hypothetical protein MAR_017536 [Mya arenaria]